MTTQEDPQSKVQSGAEGPRIHPSADVASDAVVGDGASIWHLAQVREGACIGHGTSVGRGAYIGAGVRIGSFCKIQNHALVYEPSVLEDGVFVGPAAVFTNDHFPRAITPEGMLTQSSDWEPVGVLVRYGASVGARAVCVAPVTIGRWSLVAAGAVVVSDVPDHALVGGVPARQLGWVGRSGRRLESLGAGVWRCPQTSETYIGDSAGLILSNGAPVERDASRSPDA